MNRGFERAHRVADLIQKTLAPLLLQEMRDEQFHLVTITHVVVTRDLSYAKVFISLLTDEADEIKTTISALNGAAKTFRYQLAKAIKLRIVPELKFVYDDTAARGFRISTLIEAVTKDTKK